ncbi:MAG: xanthine dehydrogenase accessory factor [Planctomycetota bacterium]|jgi:xanthine dehydrogenase accessory factor
MDPSQAWIETLADLRERSVACALVVVTGVKGSAPRELGARMIVAEGGLAWGTIGGGKLELLAIEKANELLEGGETTTASVAFPLAESAGQCCGGEVTLLIEAYRWQRHRVVIFGAGHVGQSLAGLGPWMGADVSVVDARTESELTPRPSAAREWTLVHGVDPVSEVEILDPESTVLVMTHSHGLDLDLLCALLRRRCFPYLGLIGSQRKWTRFQLRLGERGFDGEAIARVTCPIGVTLGSKEPRAIALSVATQLVELFARGRQG